MKDYKELVESLRSNKYDGFLHECADAIESLVREE